MNIFTALKCLAAGKKIKHVSWDKGEYIYLDQENDHFNLKDESNESYSIYVEEILESIKSNNTGWKVLKKKEKKTGFPFKIGDFLKIKNPTYLTNPYKIIYIDEQVAVAVEESNKKDKNSLVIYKDSVKAFLIYWEVLPS